METRRTTNPLRVLTVPLVLMTAYIDANVWDLGLSAPFLPSPADWQPFLSMSTLRCSRLG